MSPLIRRSSCGGQLGFAHVSAVYSSAHFGHGRGSILLDEVACTGSETRISECSHNGWGLHDCGHTEDAGVRCTNDTEAGKDISGGTCIQRLI